MKRPFDIIILVNIIIVVTLSIVFAQSHVIILNNENIFIEKQRSPVSFPHKKHMDSVDCRDCHHLYQDGKNVIKVSELKPGDPMVKCSNCHGAEDVGNSYNLMDAFHIQCIECHRKNNQEGLKTGPMLCGECHPRN
ncbi:cytochrome c3 family protein [Spirochaetota bacterium]